MAVKFCLLIFVLTITIKIKNMTDIINTESFGFDWMEEIESANPEMGQLLGNDIKDFIFGGNATFTVINTQTKNRFTFKVKHPKGNKDVFFVSVLNGSDNYSNYTFVGTFFSKSNSYRYSKKSSVGSDAQSAKVISWFFSRFIDNEEKYPFVQVYHEGKCGSCGRKLTTPQSIKTGRGPVCSGKKR
jgi:hypothetical protein